MILALFTTSIAGSASVPETAFGHIAMAQEETLGALPGERQRKNTDISRDYARHSVGSVAATSGASAETESIVREYFSDIPVMIEVARCESTFRHTLSDGSVLQGRVDSADTGVMQINKRYHQRAAHAMNLDLENIYDNMAYARHLYETQGIQPWSASAPCWNRTLAANI